MEQERKNTRKNLLYYLGVKDKKTGEMIGRTVDISTGGIRICSRDPISRATEFNFSIDLPKAWHDEKPLSIKARALWTRKDVNPELYVTGFTFGKVTAAGQQKINRLMNAASFPNSFEANAGVDHRSMSVGEAALDSCDDDVESWDDEEE